MSLSGSSWIFLLVAAVEIVRSSSLTGDHVCSRVEKLVSREENDRVTIAIVGRVII